LISIASIKDAIRIILALYQKAFVPQVFTHSISQVSLQFDRRASHGATGAACALQLLCKSFQEFAVVGEVIQDRYDLAPTALLLDPQFGDHARRDGLLDVSGATAFAVVDRPPAP
jgi:hypothetical protein